MPQVPRFRRITPDASTEVSFEYPLPGIYAGEAEWHELVFEVEFFYSIGEPVHWELGPGSPPHLEDIDGVYLLDANDRILRGHNFSRPHVGTWPPEASIEEACHDWVADNVSAPSSHRYYY